MTQGRAGADSKVRLEGTTDWLPLALGAWNWRTCENPTPPPVLCRRAAAGFKTEWLGRGVARAGDIGCIFLWCARLWWDWRWGNHRDGECFQERWRLCVAKGWHCQASLCPRFPCSCCQFPRRCCCQHLLQRKQNQRSRSTGCVNNEKQLALAVRICVGDHTDHFPPSATLEGDAIQEKASVGSEAAFLNVLGGELHGLNPTCATTPSTTNWTALDTSKVNPHTVMIFEADGAWNAHGGIRAACFWPA